MRLVHGWIHDLLDKRKISTFGFAAGNFAVQLDSSSDRKAFRSYRHIDMAGNYAGVNVRLNYGNKDFIRFYRDLNRIWTQVLATMNSRYIRQNILPVGWVKCLSLF
jgi:hypothetical protein